MKIGFFDSGIGGLTILKTVREVLPDYDYVFYGDTEHLPYGDKTEEEIYRLTQKGVEYLFKKGAMLVIIACNTASAESLRKLQDTFLREHYPERRVLGVIIPTIETLAELKVTRPLLIGTIRTVNSKKYEVELEKVNSDISIVSEATPNLVPLIELGEISEAIKQASKVIDSRVGEIDAVILGCTHYGLLKDELRNQYTVPIIAQDEIIPEKLKSYLEMHPEIESQISRTQSLEIVLTKESEYYSQLKKSLI